MNSKVIEELLLKDAEIQQIWNANPSIDNICDWIKEGNRVLLTGIHQKGYTLVKVDEELRERITEVIHYRYGEECVEKVDQILSVLKEEK